MLLLALASACASKPRPKAVEFPEGHAPQLVGRWIFSPGDSTLVAPARGEAAEEATESPAGSTLALGEGGVMTARAGDFVRRGTWKANSGMLRMIIDPPPERRELNLTVQLEVDRLTLTGDDGLVLVYHRDPFVALPGNAPPVSTTANTPAPAGAAPASIAAPAAAPATKVPASTAPKAGAAAAPASTKTPAPAAAGAATKPQ
jgi:hypothetical protein